MLEAEEEMLAIVHGRVQGVGFRAAVKRHADRLKLKGFVCNLEDGSVKICAQGSKYSLEQLMKDLKVQFGEGIREISISFFSPKGSLEAFQICT